MVVTATKQTPKEIREKATSIQEFSTFKSTRDRLKAVLDVLSSQENGEIVNKSGAATAVLHGMLPEEVRNKTATSFGTSLRDMRESGFIELEAGPRKTYKISLGNKVPTDWTPPEVAVDPGMFTKEEADEFINHHVLNPDTTPYTPPSLEQEARDGDIRPGRLAARLEKMQSQIPALVEEGVTEGIKGFFIQFAAAMGFQAQATVDVTLYDQIDKLTTRLVSVNGQINELQDELRQERTAGHAVREELNKILRTQQSTKEMSPVKSADVAEAWRDLAKHAIASGWTIHRTGGGHLQWRSPTGFRYFSSNTTSDYRAVRNARSDMEKEGLPSV